MFRSKKFRAVISALLAVLVLIHTTPLYAATAKSRTTSTKSTTTKSNAPALDPGGDPSVPERTVPASSGAQQAPAESPTGAAAYSIPIEVPKGRGNIAPNLSLTYNSYRANGQFGVGWNLDMGAIQRSTKKGLNYAGNDFVAIVNGSSSDLIPFSVPEWGGSQPLPKQDRRGISELLLQSHYRRLGSKRQERHDLLLRHQLGFKAAECLGDLQMAS